MHSTILERHDVEREEKTRLEQVMQRCNDILERQSLNAIEDESGAIDERKLVVERFSFPSSGAANMDRVKAVLANAEGARRTKPATDSCRGDKITNTDRETLRGRIAG